MLGSVSSIFWLSTERRTTYNPEAGNAGVPSLLVPASTRTQMTKKQHFATSKKYCLIVLLS